jgi:hypothetical protein
MEHRPAKYLNFLLAFFLSVAAVSGCAPAQTPAPVEATATVTPEPRVFLSTLSPLSQVVGHATLGRGVYTWTSNPAVRGQVLSTHGQTYPQGLLAHAPSRLEYDLAGQYQYFHATITLQSGVSCGDGVIFRVMLDGIEVYSSAPVSADTFPVEVELNIGGASTLTLIADMRTTGDCDWAIWGDPYLQRMGTLQDPYPTPSPSPSPTPDPTMPCGGGLPERLYVFLECSDILRMRGLYLSGDPAFLHEWQILKGKVDGFRANFPASYDPDASYLSFWWGSSNNMPRDMALIYLVTADMEYARDVYRALELIRTNTPVRAALTDFDAPNGRGEENSGGLMSHPQYGAVYLQSILFAYLSIRDTDLFSADARVMYDAFFKHQAELLEQAAIQRGNATSIDSPINRNVPFAANTAALTIARIYAADPDMQALDARVWPILEWQIGHWWESDGGWGENTENYGYSRLESLLGLAETTLRIGGEDLYASDFNGVTLNRMCRFYLDVITPERSTPALNDTDFYFVDPGLFRVCGYRTNDAGLYFAEELYRQGRLQAYEVNSENFNTPFQSIVWWGLDDRPAQTPNFASVLLEGTGAAILRDGWERDSQYALLQFTASRSHEEKAFGTLYLYADGPWLVGNGYHIPSAKPTDQHSTLGLDHADQTYTGGEVLAFADLGRTGIAAISSQSYSTLRHIRTLLWNQTWAQWIVVDDAIGDANPHTLQQRWYVRGDVVNQDGGTWIFNHPANSDQLAIQMLPGIPASYAMISRHYDSESWVSDANGVRMDVGYPRTPVRLVTSLAVTSSGGEVITVTRQDESGGTLINSWQGNLLWVWVLPPIQAQDAEIAGISLRGAAGCLASRGDIRSGFCLFNGDQLSLAGQVLVDSTVPVSVDASFQDSVLVVEAPETARLKFYWPSPVASLVSDQGSLTYLEQDGLIVVELSAGHHVIEIR